VRRGKDDVRQLDQPNRPLRTQEELSALSGGVDDLAGVEGKRTTTVRWTSGRSPSSRRIPFVPAVNHFDGAPRCPVEEVRAAIALAEHVPLVACDGRRRTSTTNVLLCLVDHLLQLAPADDAMA
jgi:hypothetical protein